MARKANRGRGRGRGGGSKNSVQVIEEKDAASSPSNPVAEKETDDGNLEDLGFFAGSVHESASDDECELMAEPAILPDPVPILEQVLSEGPGDDRLPSSSGVKQDWKGLFPCNSSFGKLQYFEPLVSEGKVFVKPSAAALAEGVAKWRPSLVGQFIDKPLPFFLVKKSLELLWNHYGKFEIFSLENGLFIFRFENESICEAILEAKLWHIANKPLILRKWMPGMQLMKISLSSVPIWIKLRNLPMECWTSLCLSYVASGVGKPLYADSVTEEQKRLGFARVLVEVNVHSLLPKEVSIMLEDGDKIDIEIEYPWLPPKCTVCNSFGHPTYACAKQGKPKWIPKKNVVQKAVPKVSTGDTSKTSNLDKVIRRPEGPKRSSPTKSPVRTGKLPSTSPKGSKGNSFQVLEGRCEVEEGLTRSPFTFMEIFENALSNPEVEKQKRGKEKLGVTEGRGFSPTSVCP